MWAFQSHAHLDFDGRPNYKPRANIGFDDDLNAGIGGTISKTTFEFDDETEGGSVNGGAMLRRMPDRLESPARGERSPD